MLKCYIICLISLFAASIAWSQSSDVELAEEYVSKAEYNKAYLIFEKAAKKKENQQRIHESYFKTIVALNKIDEGKSQFKKWQKNDPQNVHILADLYLLENGIETNVFSQKLADKLFDNLPNVVQTGLNLSTHFSNRRNYFIAAEVLQYYRSKLNDKRIYASELGSLYLQLKKYDSMFDELLYVVDADPSKVEIVQQRLQQFVSDSTGQQIFLDRVYAHLPTVSSESRVYDLLVWYFVQQRDFSSAFREAKALDKRRKTQGMPLMEIGALSMENEDWNTSVQVWDYLVKTYPNEYYQLTARRQLLLSREEKIKRTYPVDTASVRVLMTEYNQLILSIPSPQDQAPIIRQKANLNAFYMHNLKDAISELLTIIPQLRNQDELLAQIKLDLADFYLLNEEPWESALLYGQVERMFTDHPMAHLAKLKNAKLSFYKGDFEYAKEQLDILKLATSREIANDALQLGLLIQDNFALDTTSEALALYAKAELLVFQTRYLEAEAKYNFLLQYFSKHSLTDEIHWSLANMYLKIGQDDKAIPHFETIITNYKYDILADDAYFQLAYLYETRKKDVNKAMQLYELILKDFPGSIYVVEARKRFRQLRGDNVN